MSLYPAGSHDVYGGPEPDAWTYRTTLYGPSTSTTAVVGAAEVVHVRYAVAPHRPWRGLSPLNFAAATGRLHGAVVAALADEAGGPVGHVFAGAGRTHGHGR